MKEEFNINEHIKVIIQNKPDSKVVNDALKELDVNKHKVMLKKYRPDKAVETDKGPDTVKVARIPVALQKLIVKRAVSFLLGKPIRIMCDAKPNTAEEKRFMMTQKTWETNKLHFKSKKIATHYKSETECAELWYFEEVDPSYWGELGNSRSNVRLRVKILAPSLGDTLFPVYDQMGDLIAFGRKYTVRVDKKDIEYFDLYTDDIIYYTVKQDGVWTLTTSDDPDQPAGAVENPIGKIPVIYYYQQDPEWADVQAAIERLETLLSNFADTNDYFASPMVFIEGEVTGFAKKGEQGKVLKGKLGSKASYLTWDAAPAAIKLEIETLFDIIYIMTQTPDISFKGMTGLGASPSGVALDRVLIDGQLKARDDQDGNFGECIQRRLNLLDAIMPIINDDLAKTKPMSIWAEFDTFKIDNIKEDLENISLAIGNKPFMSMETAMELNPLVSDPKQESKRIKDEALLIDQEDNIIE